MSDRSAPSGRRKRPSRLWTGSDKVSGTALANPFSDSSVRATDPVRSIMSSPVASLDLGATLREAAEELLRNDIGTLLVTDGARTGLISERDLIALLATSADAASAQVVDVPTWDLVWAAPDASIADVAALMIEANVRHVPIGDGRSAVGMVSVRDILAVLLSSNSRPVLNG